MSQGFWNYTIDDSSPLFIFQPYGDGGADNFTQNGWLPWYTTSHFATSGGEAATGDSYHITSLAGASVSLAFQGSAIYLHGNASCPYDVALDDSQSSLSPRDGLLFAAEGLPQDTHYVNLTLRPTSVNQQLAFDRADISSAKINSPPIPYIYDNSNSSLLYSGNWSFPNNDGHIPNTSHPSPYHKTSSFASSVALNFTGVAVAINGSRDWGHWTYNVTLDSVPVPVMYNASTMWLIGDSLLFYQTGLDPTQPHTIELANTGPNGMALSLNSITVWAPNTTVANPSVSRTSATGGSHSSNKVAEIVGPIVGVIGVIIICASLLAFRKYRRRRPLPPHEEVTPYPPMLSMEKASAMPDRDIHPNSSTVPLHSGGIWRKAAPVVSQPAAVSRAPSAVPSNRPPESNNGVAVSRAVSSRVSAAHTQEGSSHPSQSQAGMVNVDRIIELIAQRIDRSSALPISEDPLAPPPQYPADPADAYTQ